MQLDMIENRVELTDFNRMKNYIEFLPDKNAVSALDQYCSNEIHSFSEDNKRFKEEHE